MAADPRGGVVFSEGVAGIGRIDPAGHRTQVGPAHTYAQKIAVTADGAVWFTLAYARGGRLGRLGPAGAFSEVRLPNSARPVDVLAGAEGDVWYAATYPGNCGIQCNENVEIPAEGVVGRISPAPVAEPDADAAMVHDGRAIVTMDCAGASAGACDGTFQMRRRGKMLGSGAYALGAGTDAPVVITLGPRLQRSLVRCETLRVEAVAVESDGTTARRRLVLRAASS